MAEVEEGLQVPLLISYFVTLLCPVLLAMAHSFGYDTRWHAEQRCAVLRLPYLLQCICMDIYEAAI
jgi:hypothetical protein